MNVNQGNMVAQSAYVGRHDNEILQSLGNKHELACDKLILPR